MSAPQREEVNPFAAPAAADEPPAGLAKTDADLRHEYLGAILLAVASGTLACLLLLASTRYPTSDFGELIRLLAGWAAVALAMVSVIFVFITLRAAVSRLWRLLRIIRGYRQ